MGVTSMTGPSHPSREALIAGALRRWVDALTDLGGRNRLLYYKDLRLGTLALESADPVQMEQLLAVGKVRLSRLFPDEEAQAEAIRRVRAIHRKARELIEERGINATYLATGMATWKEEQRSPTAPVLLRALRLVP